MLQLLGTVSQVDREMVETAGGSFEAVELRVVSGEGRTSFVRLGRDFVGAEPVKGDYVCLAVWVRPYVSKKTDSLGYGLTAYMRVDASAPAVPVAV